MNSKSKLGARVEDRISQLPDELICHILSFLPTVDSVQTIVLSKRWSNLWTLVNTLDINFERDFWDPLGYNDFAKFVDGALSSHGSSNIKRFRLSCPRMSYYLPASGCFSSLKSLYLWVHYHDPPDIENLITNCCPVLEELEISGSCIGLFPDFNRKIRLPDDDTDDMYHDDDTDDIYYFNISAPKLKRLTLDFFFDGYGWSYVLLNTTKLEHLYVKGININFILVNPKSLDKAEIDQSLSLKKGYTHDHTMTKLLAGLSNVKDLSIRSAVFETCKLPSFNNLNKLELILHSYGEYITKFLKRSPNLEHLILELDNKNFRAEKTFTPPEFVPVCLSSHLKTIYMRGFNGRWVELEVLNYLLGYGQVLDELIISSHPTLGHRKEESLSKEILLFPRASRTCEVKFM